MIPSTSPRAWRRGPRRGSSPRRPSLAWTPGRDRARRALPPPRASPHPPASPPAALDRHQLGADGDRGLLAPPIDVQPDDRGLEPQAAAPDLEPRLLEAPPQ